MKFINKEYNDYRDILVAINTFLVKAWAAILVVSAFLKVLDSTETVETVKSLFKYYQYEENYQIIYFLVYMLIASEIVLGYLLICYSRSMSAIIFSILMVVGFIYISNILEFLKENNSCGCFGILSASITFIHFPLLYSAVVILVLQLFISMVCNRRSYTAELVNN